MVIALKIITKNVKNRRQLLKIFGFGFAEINYNWPWAEVLSLLNI